MIIYNLVTFLYILIITGILFFKNTQYFKKEIEIEQKIIISNKDKQIQKLKQEILELQDIIALPIYNNIETYNSQEQAKIQSLENEIYNLTTQLDEMQNTINSIYLKDFYWFGRKGIVAHVNINEGINIRCDSDDPESEKFCRNLKYALQKIIPSNTQLSFKIIS